MIRSGSASLGLKLYSCPRVLQSISLFSFSQEIKCSTKSCPKKGPKRGDAAEQKPCTQAGPSVVAQSLFAACLSNTAKLAGSYAAYSSSATKLYKPRDPRFGMLQEKPTCLHREPVGENPPRDANGSTFPTNMGLELLGWILCTHPEAAVRSLLHLASLKRALQFDRCGHPVRC